MLPLYRCSENVVRTDNTKASLTTEDAYNSKHAVLRSVEPEPLLQVDCSQQYRSVSSYDQQQHCMSHANLVPGDYQCKQDVT